MEDDDNYDFEGLETIAGQIRRRTDDIAYVVMQDRTVAGQDEKVGRLDLSPDQFEALGLDWTDDNEDIAEQALTWIRNAAIEGTRGHGWRRFRVKSVSSRAPGPIASPTTSPVVTARNAIRPFPTWRPEHVGNRPGACPI